MACMTSGASSVTLQSLYWRSSDNFSVPAESSRVNWCSPAKRLEDEIRESRSLEKGRVAASNASSRVGINAPPRRSPPGAQERADLPFSRGGMEQVAHELRSFRGRAVQAAKCDCPATGRQSLKLWQPLP